MEERFRSAGLISDSLLELSAVCHFRCGVSMKKLLALIFTFSCVLAVFGQEKSVGTKAEKSEIVIRKQIICDDLEKQVKEIPFAAVRVFARHKIASWLWKDGKDETGRAENLAVTAIDDLYENKAEIPPVSFDWLRLELFTLLDHNARDAANKSREKHNAGPTDDPNFFDSLPDQKEGEKIAVDGAIKSLVDQSQGNPDIHILIGRLQARKSVELLRLLIAILNAEETGRTQFTATSLLFISPYFVEPSVPVQIQKRFLKLIVDKSKTAALTPNGDVEGFFWLLNGRMPDFSTIFLELAPEAGAVHTVLKTRVSRESRESQERSDRIRDSADKLNTAIAEAEKAADKGTKYNLYVFAAQLALKEKKFNYSVDIAGKAAEIDLPSGINSEKSRKRLFDQFLKDVVGAALQSDDPDSANYATKKISDPLSKAENLRKTANYYFDHSNPVAAGSALDEAIKLIIKAEGGNERIVSLINILPTTQKIDRTRISDLGELTAKYINSIPSLNVDDKPGTENFKSYVTFVMAVNWNLLPVLTKLLKENRSGAADLAGRINKKEIRVIADLALSTDSVASKQ